MQLLMHRIGSFMVLAALAGTVAACGSTARPHARQTHSSSNRGLPGAPPANWDNPIRGKPVADLSSILPQFRFPVRLPLTFGTLRGTFASRDYRPGDPPENLVLELVYDHPSYGRIVVLEYASPYPSQSAYDKAQQDQAEASGKPGMYGTARLVRLSSGQEVLVGTNSEGNGSYLNWYEPWPAGHDFLIAIFALGMDQQTILNLAEQLSQSGGYRTPNR